MALKVGNVLNFKYNNPVSNTISSFMGDYWTHSAIIVQIKENDIYLFEALGTYKNEKYKPSGIYKKFKFLLKVKSLFSGRVNINKYNKNSLIKLLDENKLKVMHFKINDFSNFNTDVTLYNHKQYDYFSTLSIAIKRLFSLFGKNYTNDKKTTEKLFCSELVGRILNNSTKFNILELANKKSFEELTPQDLSLVYDKLKYYQRI